MPRLYLHQTDSKKNRSSITRTKPQSTRKLVRAKATTEAATEATSEARADTHKITMAGISKSSGRKGIRSSPRRRQQQQQQNLPSAASSTIQSRRFHIQVEREREPGKEQENFPDDQAYWKAAREATMNNSSHNNYNNNNEDRRHVNDRDLEDEEEEEEGLNVNQLDPSKIKKKQKKKIELVQLKEQYDNYIGQMKSPNFHIGQVGGGTNNTNNIVEGEKEIRRLHNQKRRNNNLEDQAPPPPPPGILSPSDMSRVSTIPPTPQTQQLNPPSSAMSTRSRLHTQGEDDIVDEEEEVEIMDDDLFPGSFDDNDNEKHDFNNIKNKDDNDETQFIQKQKSSSVQSQFLSSTTSPPPIEENINDMLQTSFDLRNNASTTATSIAPSTTPTTDDKLKRNKLLKEEMNNRTPGTEIEEVEQQQQEDNEQQEFYNDDDDDDGDYGFELADTDDLEENNHGKDTQEANPKMIMDKNNKEDNGSLTGIEGEEEGGGKSSMKEKSKLKKKKKKKKTTDDEDETNKTPNAKDGGNSKQKRKRKVRLSNKIESIGYPAGNRNYKSIPVSEYENESDDDDDEQKKRRRSKRRKFPPLAFWKNERVLYEAHNETGNLAEAFGDMPVVSGILTAEPTPYKKRKVSKVALSKKKKSNKRNIDDDEGEESGSESSIDRSKKKKKSKEITEDHMKPFNSTKLRKKFKIQEGQMADIWNEAIGEIEERKLFAYQDDLRGHELPQVKRNKGESKVFGLAAQAFNVPADASTLMPGYISGNLVLPPKGIKDAEGVGICAQVFNICDCQPKSVEIAIADPDVNEGKFEPNSAQRFLLSKGEMFHVPPGNIYRIENHSKKVDCTLYWTIIRPMKPRPEE